MTEENNFYQEAHKTLEEELPTTAVSTKEDWDKLLDLVKSERNHPYASLISLKDGAALRRAVPIVVKTEAWETTIPGIKLPEMNFTMTKQVFDPSGHWDDWMKTWLRIGGYGNEQPVVEPNTHIFLENMGLDEITIGDKTYTAEEFAEKYPYIWPTTTEIETNGVLDVEGNPREITMTINFDAAEQALKNLEQQATMTWSIDKKTTSHEDLKAAWDEYSKPKATIEDLKNVVNPWPGEDTKNS